MAQRACRSNVPRLEKDWQFIWRGVHPGENRSWCFSKEKLEELFEQGLIELQKNGKLRKDGLKKYPSDSEGSALNNLWDDIGRVGNPSKERIGYPTPKPEVLMHRIISMANTPGDIILDPFMGGGTTMAVADKLHRQWIGIDQSVTAVKVPELRLDKQQDMFSEPYSTQLHKYAYNTLRHKNAFVFESWIIRQFGGIGNVTQRNDSGLDGKSADDLPIQVKRSDGIGRNIIDNFLSATKRAGKTLFTKNVKEKKSVWYIIAFSFGKGTIDEVARLKNQENVIVKLVRVDEIVPLASKPAIKVNFREIEKDAKGNRVLEFTAKETSESAINFYIWDFEYDEKKGFKLSQLIDKIP